MPENKTKPTDQNVQAYLDTIEDEKKRADSLNLIQIMREVSGYEPQMWGSSMIGFGSYRYKYATGHSGETMLIGFAPRKQNITLYLMGLYIETDEPEQSASALLDQLGKYKPGKGCLYIKRLEDVDVDVLKQIIERSTAQIRAIYPD